MALTTIYPNGIAEISIPATQSIAISNYGGGIARIYYLIQNANRPDAWQFQQTLEDSAVTLGAFANGQAIMIESGPSKVIYEVGASPSTGFGDSDTLGGNPASYYAADSGVVHIDGDETVNDIKTHTNHVILNNARALKGKETGGTERFLAVMNGSNEISIGQTSNVLSLNSNGTLKYNAATLPTGTFTTTDGKTITVTDGFITAITGP